MKKYLISILFLVFSTFSHAQTNGKLWGGLEVGYGLGLSERGNGNKLSYGGDTKMSISTLRGVIGYYVVPQFSVGAGIGLNGYTRTGLNILPVCLDLRYHPLNNRNFLLNTDIGYSITTSENNRKGKFFTDFSVGYKVGNIGKFSLIPSIGYNLVNYSINEETKLTRTRHSVFIKLGIIL